MAVTKEALNLLLGKSIKLICRNGYDDVADNHCAHFVSHVLEYGFGYLCTNMKSGKFPGASIRVQQVFEHCPIVGRWTERPATTTQCLIFVTAISNVSIPKHEMANVPKKHVGIFLDGTVWHYSNSKSQVVTQTPEQFIHHYPGKDIGLFYGTFPEP